MKRAVTVAAAVGTAVNGGVIFAFSSFVMPALDDLDPAASIAAMQAMNVEAVGPAFMAALFGTAALTLATAVIGLRQWRMPAGKLLVLGSALFLVGVIGVTIGHHVPLNDALARFDGRGDAARVWADYLRDWTGLNHLRAVAGIGAAALFTMAANAGPSRPLTPMWSRYSEH